MLSRFSYENITQCPVNISKRWLESDSNIKGFLTPGSPPAFQISMPQLFSLMAALPLATPITVELVLISND